MSKYIAVYWVEDEDGNVEVGGNTRVFSEEDDTQAEVDKLFSTYENCVKVELFELKSVSKVKRPK